MNTVSLVTTNVRTACVSPSVHDTKWWFGFAVAVSVTVSPWLYWPLPLTLPIVGVVLFTVTVYWFTTKMAVYVASPVTSAMVGLQPAKV